MAFAWRPGDEEIWRDVEHRRGFIGGDFLLSNERLNRKDVSICCIWRVDVSGNKSSVGPSSEKIRLEAGRPSK